MVLITFIYNFVFIKNILHRISEVELLINKILVHYFDYLNL